MADDDAGKIQLQIVLPYKDEARSHGSVRGYLERGYRIVDLQRVTDREVVVTLAAPGA
jgi:hypothetical protein